MPILKKCLICEKEFKVIPSRKNAKYCSKKCKFNGTKTGSYLNCDFCGKKIWVYCFQLRHKKHFCSTKCRDVFQKKQNHPRWKNEFCRIDNKGYIFIKTKEYPKGIYEHRYVLEKHLGRKLLPTEFAHHINGLKTDNRIENLLIMSNSDHVKLHSPDFTAKWTIRHDFCLECGRNDIRHAGFGLCNNCYHRRRRAANKTQI